MAKAKKVKAEDLKGKTQDELHKLLLDTRKDQMNLRFQRSGGQLEKVSEMRKTRRDVARIKTQLSALRNTAAGTPAKATKAAAKKTAKAAKLVAKSKKTAA